jgi:hypothetical protein
MPTKGLNGNSSLDATRLIWRREAEASRPFVVLVVNRFTAAIENSHWDKWMRRAKTSN